MALGWLTSVENEPTRALCKYCNKNLHAHRLSLLKHTCTLKHTRATTLHAENLKKKRLKSKGRTIKTESPMILIEEVDLGTLKTSMSADEEAQETDDLIYDEERLDDENNEDEDADIGADSFVEIDDDGDDDEDGDSQNIDEMQIEIPDDNDENSDSCVLRVESEEDDNNNNDGNDDDNNGKMMLDRSKIKTEVVHTDTLAQAMAHVHGITDNDEEMSETLHTEIEHDVDDNTTILNDENTAILSDHNVTIETTVSTSSPVKSTEDNNSVAFKTNQNNKKIVSNDKKVNKQIVTKTKSGMPFQRVSVNGKTYNFPSGQLITNSQILLANAINKNNITTITVPASSKTSLRPIAPKINKSVFVTTPVSSSTNKVLTRQISSIKKNNDAENSIEFITTHVIDTNKGIPANSMRICLYKLTDGRWNFINER